MIIVKNRADFIKSLPKNGIIAEVGVLAGAHAITMLTYAEPKMMYLIDPWEHTEDREDQLHFGGRIIDDDEWFDLYKRVKKTFQGYQNVKLIKMFSGDAAAIFPDNYFDWVYIDANHAYEACKQDLLLWYPKIRSGGFLCGHDYADNAFNLSHGFGVKQAVDEFLQENKLEISILAEHNTSPCFGIQKV